jgi:predicted ATPase
LRGPRRAGKLDPMPTIRTPDQRVRVFISSTMDELADERSSARRAVEALHLSPVLFEMGARPHPPRELYRAYLEQSDIFVGIYGEEYGWIAPGSTISGIEDEYELSAGTPRLVYVREPAAGRDPRLGEMLQRILSDGLSYRTYRRPAELQRMIADDLAGLLSERFEPSAGEASGPDEVELRHELPSATTRFVGRHGMLLDLQEMLRVRDVRLLTLTGPGGIGKTRLALALAHACRDRFEDGAAVVFLAPVRSADLVTTKIATTLGLPVSASRSAAEVLRDYLTSREMLLLIDNFEHVIDAAPVLVELLGECPRVRIVVTSREMLRLSAEQVFPVPALTVGTDSDGPGEAVELFLDRATAIRHDLPLTGDVLAAVTEICRRLDGLPLAIELAAARVRVLMPQEILARLHKRLDFLTSGSSDFPERQRTLRGAIEWSYDLLNEHEKALFECLAVFRGGFTLDAAEGVIRGAPDLLEGLASLMDKSLIRSDPTVGEPRFMMLETLREFALERLEEQSGLEDVRRRHAEYFTDWVTTLDTDRREAESVRLMRLDNDNMRAAMAWLIESGDPGRVARAAAALWKFWWVRSLFLEGIDWMERVKGCEGPLSRHEAATVEFVIGMLSFGNGDYPRANESLTKARAEFEELGDIRGAALSWICLGVTRRVAGETAGEELLHRAVKILRASGDEWATAFALFGLGRVILMDGRVDEAVPLLEESVRRAEATDSQTLLAFALINLTWARLSMPDPGGAKKAAARALAEAGSLDNREGMARAVEALCGVALAERELQRAAVLFGGAEAIRRSIGGVVWVPDRMSHAAIATTLGDQLGTEHYNAGFERGVALPVQTVMDLAHYYADGSVTEQDDPLGNTIRA